MYCTASRRTERESPVGVTHHRSAALIGRSRVQAFQTLNRLCTNKHQLGQNPSNLVGHQRPVSPASLRPLCIRGTRKQVYTQSGVHGTRNPVQAIRVYTRSGVHAILGTRKQVTPDMGMQCRNLHRSPPNGGMLELGCIQTPAQYNTGHHRLRKQQARFVVPGLLA